MVSIATVTIIKIEAPLIAMVVMPVAFAKMIGKIAIKPKKIAPKRVILLEVLDRKLVVV